MFMLSLWFGPKVITLSGSYCVIKQPSLIANTEKIGRIESKRMASSDLFPGDHKNVYFP
jgi:hypothetical protein